MIKTYEDIVGYMYGDEQMSSGAYDGHKEEKVAA